MPFNGTYSNVILFDAKFKGLMDRIKPGIKVLAYRFIPISFVSVEAQCEKCGANGYSLSLSIKN